MLKSQLLDTKPNLIIQFYYKIKYLPFPQMIQKTHTRQVKTSIHDYTSLKNQYIPPKSSLKNIAKPPNHPLPRKNQTGSSIITSREEQMAKITREENTNLKQQNSYLLEKLRKFTKYQQYYISRFEHYETINKQLQHHNLQLQRQFRELQKSSVRKISSLKKKVAELSKVKSSDNLLNHDSQKRSRKLFQIDEMSQQTEDQVKAEIHEILSPKSAQGSESMRQNLLFAYGKNDKRGQE